MPELPEVETIRVGLKKHLVGRKVEELEVKLKRIFSGDPEQVRGFKITDVRRFGKGLVVDFASDYSLAIHVKMTGQLIFIGKGKEGTYDRKKVGATLPSAHTHVIIFLDNGTLYYNDIRQFGWMHIVKTSDLKSITFFKTLGKEPFKDLTLTDFRQILAGSGSPIKTVLMDQSKIAGIGNIYANDALFLAGIHPKRKSSSLTEVEQKKLFEMVERVLKKGIEVGGASEWQYVNADGEAGSYQNFFQVYGRVGKPCLKCKTTIEKINISGRGTFFCPKCQQL